MDKLQLKVKAYKRQAEEAVSAGGGGAAVGPRPRMEWGGAEAQERVWGVPGDLDMVRSRGGEGGARERWRVGRRDDGGMDEGWLDGWEVGQTVGWLVGWKVGWLSDGLEGSNPGCLGGWEVGQMDS